MLFKLEEFENAGISFLHVLKENILKKGLFENESSKSKTWPIVVAFSNSCFVV